MPGGAVLGRFLIYRKEGLIVKDWKLEEIGMTFQGKVVTYDKITAEKPHPNW